MSILSAVPAELITAVFTGALSFMGSILAMKMKQRAQEQKMLLERHGADEASRTRAETAGSPESQAEKRWTRRTIALAVTASVIVVPILAGMLGVHVTTGWTEMSGGFWPFVDPKPEMIWHQVHGGIVITPLHTHTMSSIIGFYFGSSIAENARI